MLSAPSDVQRYAGARKAVRTRFQDLDDDCIEVPVKAGFVESIESDHIFVDDARKFRVEPSVLALLLRLVNSARTTIASVGRLRKAPKTRRAI